MLCCVVLCCTRRAARATLAALVAEDPSELYLKQCYGLLSKLRHVRPSAWSLYLRPATAVCTIQRRLWERVGKLVGKSSTAATQASVCITPDQPPPATLVRLCG